MRLFRPRGFAADIHTSPAAASPYECALFGSTQREGKTTIRPHAPFDASNNPADVAGVKQCPKLNAFGTPLSWAGLLARGDNGMRVRAHLRGLV